MYTKDRRLCETAPHDPNAGTHLICRQDISFEVTRPLDMTRTHFATLVLYKLYASRAMLCLCCSWVFPSHRIGV